MAIKTLTKKDNHDDEDADDRMTAEKLCHSVLSQADG